MPSEAWLNMKRNLELPFRKGYSDRIPGYIIVAQHNAYKLDIRRTTATSIVWHTRVVYHLCNDMGNKSHHKSYLVIPSRESCNDYDTANIEL